MNAASGAVADLAEQTKNLGNLVADMERVILHIDLNCFYASAEMMLNPALRGKAVVVCGSTQSRHGIVLAKSGLAKKRGVKTGMVNWEASQCCPDIIMDELEEGRTARARVECYMGDCEPEDYDSDYKSDYEPNDWEKKKRSGTGRCGRW